MNTDYNLTSDEAREVGDRKIIAIYNCIEDAAEQEARDFGYLTDDNERYFNLELYGEDLLDGNYMELESGRVIYYE